MNSPRKNFFDNLARDMDNISNEYLEYLMTNFNKEMGKKTGGGQLKKWLQKSEATKKAYKRNGWNTEKSNVRTGTLKSSMEVLTKRTAVDRFTVEYFNNTEYAGYVQDRNPYLYLQYAEFNRIVNKHTKKTAEALLKDLKKMIEE